MKRNIFLVFVLIVLSLLLAIPFANFIVYKFIYNYSGDWIVPKEISDFVNGFPFVYFSLSSLLFGIWGLGKKWVWASVSILPIILLYFYINVDEPVLVWSVVFFISGIILAKLINFTISKFHRPNPPMIVK